MKAEALILSADQRIDRAVFTTRCRSGSPVPRKPREAWILAGFELLAAKGPEALTVPELAGHLSELGDAFYFNFSSMGDFFKLMLWHWEQAAKRLLPVECEGLSPEVARLHLLDLVTGLSAIPEADREGAALEAAMRRWSVSQREVAAALRRVDRERLFRLTLLFEAAGLGSEAAHSAAQTFYATLTGVEMLRATMPMALGPSLRLVLRATLRQVLPPTAPLLPQSAGQTVWRRSINAARSASERVEEHT